MNVTFWDTIKGQQLATILIKHLPKLTAEKKQKMYRMNDMKVHEFLNHLEENERYVAHFSYGGETTVILEEIQK